MRAAQRLVIGSRRASDFLDCFLNPPDGHVLVAFELEPDMVFWQASYEPESALRRRN